MLLSQDHHFMQRALALARQAAEMGEVPVGAVIVYQNDIIAEAYNQPITQCDPTAHAEIIVLREAAKKLKNYRLVDSTLYVTLEPCAMCAMAMVHARVNRLVYAADDLRTGAVKSLFHITHHEKLNHRIACESGLLAEESQALLQTFFQMRRDKK